MEKFLKNILIPFIELFVVMGLIYGSFYLLNQKDKKEQIKTKIEMGENKRSKIEKNNFVSYNGRLKIKDNKLVNKYNENIQLRGVSTHGIQWYGDLANFTNIRTLKEDFNANVFRVSMYTEESGYIQNPSLKDKLYDIVNTAINMDMYVIIDWHILSDGDPLTHVEESEKFFSEVSEKYKGVPNIIYEICNEPNGSNVTWDNNIKPYAERIIKRIRENDPISIVVVGTSTWSQDVDKAALNPIDDKYTMYSLHFYSGTHTAYLRDRVKTVIDKIPIFVTEFGVSDASGNNGVYLSEAKLWIDFLNENNISWVNWSLSNKNESSALLKPNTEIINDDNLSESGKFVKSIMNK